MCVHTAWMGKRACNFVGLPRLAALCSNHTGNGCGCGQNYYSHKTGLSGRKSSERVKADRSPQASYILLEGETIREAAQFPLHSASNGESLANAHAYLACKLRYSMHVYMTYALATV